MTPSSPRAPAPLETVRAFVNTLDVEDSVDSLATPADLTVWLLGSALVGPASEPMKSSTARAREGPEASPLRDAVRRLGAIGVLAVLVMMAYFSEGRVRVVLDLAAYGAGAFGAGEPGHEVQGHVDASADAGAGDQIPVVDEPCGDVGDDGGVDL
jgi:hypothetical protein